MKKIVVVVVSCLTMIFVSGCMMPKSYEEGMQRGVEAFLDEQYKEAEKQFARAHFAKETEKSHAWLQLMQQWSDIEKAKEMNDWSSVEEKRKHLEKQNEQFSSKDWTIIERQLKKYDEQLVEEKEAYVTWQQTKEAVDALIEEESFDQAKERLKEVRSKWTEEKFVEEIDQLLVNIEAKELQQSVKQEKQQSAPKPKPVAQETKKTWTEDEVIQFVMRSEGLSPPDPNYGGGNTFMVERKEGENWYLTGYAINEIQPGEMSHGTSIGTYRFHESTKTVEFLGSSY